MRIILTLLFVGNSLTYYNDLPSLLADIAKQDGVEIKYKTIAVPDFSIDDHLAGTSIQTAFAKERFDFVIAQQGPSALPESQALLTASSIKLSKLCSENKTKLALYMVWPELSREYAYDDVITSYSNAAKASNAILCPVGLAWKKSLSSLPLYGPDKFHPSIHGSVLAAMVIYASIEEKKDFNFMDGSKWPEISDEQLEIMKTVAIESLNDL